MVKRIILLVAMLVLVSSLYLPEMAAQEASGTIEGSLVNGTSGGSSVADVTVILNSFLDNQEPGPSLTTKAGSDGQFSFGNLSTDAKNVYQVMVTYQEADYFSEHLSFGQGETSKSANVTVYDSTGDREAVKISIAHAVINVAPGNLEIMMIYDFDNNTDKAYIGTGENTTTGKKKTLAFYLPPDATEVRFGGGLDERYTIPSHEGFIDTMAVLPGGREVVYVYKVPYAGGKYNFREKIDLSAAWFNLMVQGGGIKIKSDKLVNQEPVDIGTGVKYLYLTGNNFAPGETVSATLYGLPRSTKEKMLIALVVAALVVVVAGFGLVYRRARGKREAQPVRTENNSDWKEQKLLAELAQLDDDFEAGLIQEGAYRAERAAKKAQLVKLISSSREANSH